MRFYTKFIMLFLLVSVFACNNDEDNNPETDSIVGKWTVTAATCDDGTTTVTAGGVTSTSTFTFTAEDITSEVEFSDDGKFSSTGSYTQKMTISSGGQTFNQDVVFEAFAETGTYSVSGNAITFTNDGSNEGPSEAEILELDGDNLEIKVSLENTQSQQGVISETSGNVFYTLERIE